MIVKTEPCWHTQTCYPSLVQRRDINQQPRGWDLHQVNIKHSFGTHQILTGHYQESANQGSFKIEKRLPFSVQSFIVSLEVSHYLRLLSHSHSAPCCLSQVGLVTTGWLTAKGCAFICLRPTRRKNNEISLCYMFFIPKDIFVPFKFCKQHFIFQPQIEYPPWIHLRIFYPSKWKRSIL